MVDEVASGPQMIMDYSSNTTGYASTLLSRRSRGTNAAPTAVQSGDSLAVFGGGGYGATGWSSAGRAVVKIYAAENWTDAAQGAYLTFETAATGGTSRTEKMRVDGAGNVGIGTTSPAHRLTVDATNNIIAKFTSSNVTNAAIDLGNSSGSGNSMRFQINSDSDARPNNFEIWSITPANTNLLTIKQNGAVGIGTTNPVSKLIVAPPGAQTIAGGNTITADACGTIKTITSGGAVTTNTTNTFTASTADYAGCCMDVINVGANNITLDFNAEFSSAGGANVVLGANDTARVCSNGTKWFQIGATGNN